MMNMTKCIIKREKSQKSSKTYLKIAAACIAGLVLSFAISQCLEREMLEETGMKIQITQPLGSFDVLINSPYNGYNYTHHIALLYAVIITDQLKEKINAYVPDNNGIVENDSIGYKWINLQELNNTNSSPLVQKTCEILNQINSFELIKFNI